MYCKNAVFLWIFPFLTDLEPVWEHAENIVKGDVLSVMQLLQLVAHVLEQESVFLRIDLQTAFQQSEDELDSPHRNHAALVDVHNVPSDLYHDKDTIKDQFKKRKEEFESYCWLTWKLFSGEDRKIECGTIKTQKWGDQEPNFTWGNKKLFYKWNRQFFF